MESWLEAVDLWGGTSRAETIIRWGGRRDENRDSNHWLALSRGNAASGDYTLISFMESWLEALDL
jgi:hypothetical protein